MARLHHCATSPPADPSYTTWVNEMVSPAHSSNSGSSENVSFAQLRRTGSDQATSRTHERADGTKKRTKIKSKSRRDSRGTPSVAEVEKVRSSDPFDWLADEDPAPTREYSATLKTTLTHLHALLTTKKEREEKGMQMFGNLFNLVDSLEEQHAMCDTKAVGVVPEEDHMDQV